MKSTENIERLIKRFCAGKKAQIKTTPELDEKILTDALPAQNKTKTTQSAAVQPHIWRIIMRNRMTKYAAAAVIILAIIIGIVELGRPVGASAAFAAAMDNIKQARTFSCIEIFETSYKDSQGRRTCLFKQRWMFKEPDRERHEILASAPTRAKQVGQVTIWHYGKRQMLEFWPFDKTAEFHDMSSDYEVDDKTGEVRLTQLDTYLRDKLLKWSTGAVEDQGSVELDGRTVRMLQSHKDSRTTTVWIDPKTSFPVQIELTWTDKSRSPVKYTSIQIDTEMDDDLFSLEPPEGYTVALSKPLYSDDRQKMLAKIMHLGKCCMVYAYRHNDQYPGEIAYLVKGGVITDEALKKVRSAPDEPDGPPVIQYRRPDTNAPDWSIEVMLYEIHEDRSADGRVMVVMLDSHGELMPVQTLAQHLKPWPEHKKKLSIKMTHLHWLCDQYAQKHGDKYPARLEDLVGAEFSEDMIRYIQAPWGEPDEPAVIRYRPLPLNSELSAQIIFYEIFDQWPDDGAVVCYADGHCEIIQDQNRFEELIR